MQHAQLRFTAQSGTITEDLKEMRAEAWQLAAYGNFAAALELMANVVLMQENPSASDYDRCSVYAWNMKRYLESLAYCEKSLEKHGRTIKTLHNLAAIHGKLRNHSAALAVGQELLELGEKNHRTFSMMAYAARGVEDFEASIRYGELALAALEASIPEVPPMAFPRRKIFELDKKSRNIISFSLWGQATKYLRGVVPFPDAELWPGGGWHVGINEAAGNPDLQELLLREYCARCPHCA